MLKPSLQVSLEYESFTTRHGLNLGQFSGFHARLTDSGNSAQIYKQKLLPLLRKDPAVFLSSDSPDTIIQLIGGYSNLIYRKNINLPQKNVSEYGWEQPVSDSDGRLFSYNIRRSKASTIDAMIDLSSWPLQKLCL